MLRKLLAALGNPRVKLALACAAAVAVAAGGLRLLTDNLLLIALVLAFLVVVTLLAVLVRLLLTQERERRRERGVVEQDADAVTVADRNASAATLDGSVRGALATVRDRVGNIYKIPWFVVLGERGAGKTALLAESGLDLPAEHARGRVFGPTQSADVVLANQAIMVDLAGRFMEGGADTEWRSLLDALAGGRPDCPVNGVVFALPVPTLLTSSADAIADLARQLRRRLNELHDTLGVDAPVYILITKADLIEGFLETIGSLVRLHPERQGEAFGWTNDQDAVPPQDLVARAFREICERLDGNLPGLLRHEPDSAQRRRLLGFPQELRELVGQLATFIGVAFKKSEYDEVPFLRGVYLTSARPEGDAIPVGLRRLGHEWAHARHSPGGPGRLFLRDLFLEIIAKDSEVAISGSRVSSLAQRLTLLAAAAALVAAIGTWSLSFWQNLSGTRRLAEGARLMQAADVRMSDFDQMQSEISDAESRAAGFVNRLGFRRLARAVDQARANYLAGFDLNVDTPLFGRLRDELQQRDERVVPAAVAVAGYMDLMSERSSEPPDLAPYLQDPGQGNQYANAYKAFVAWLSRPEKQRRLADSGALIGASAQRILDIGRLEQLTRSRSGPFPSIAYPVAIASEAASESTSVPGVFTRRGFDGLITTTLSAVRNSGAVDPAGVKAFEKIYAERYDMAWRRYLMDVPDAPRIDPEAEKSAYVEVLDALAEHADLAIVREGPPPSWVELVRRVHADEPAEGAPSAPWLDYREALKRVSLDTLDARASGRSALDMARLVAGKEPNSFDDALALIENHLRPIKDPSVSAKVRRLLGLPVLNAFSAVLERAQAELDAQWSARVAQPFGARELNDRDLAALYGPGGELARLRSEQLAPFIDDSGPRPLLADLAFPFGSDFLRWMSGASRMERTFSAPGSSSPVAVRVQGEPTRGLQGLVAKWIEIELVCAAGPQTFRHRGASDSRFAFAWTSACDELTLQVLLTDGKQEQRVSRQWRGPLAMPEFLRDGAAGPRGTVEWTLESGDEEFKVPFKLLAGAELRALTHDVPPRSLGRP